MDQTQLFFPNVTTAEKIENLNEIVDTYELLSPFTNFPCDSIVKVRNKELHQKILQNIIISREVCILRLCCMEDFKFFDTPEPYDMYKCATMVPVQISKHFNTLISQSLMSIIRNIYDKTDDFAEKMLLYFSQDLSNHTIFGLSTFPALYGYFVNKRLCKYGSKLLEKFLANESHLHLADTMLTSYFFCAFSFTNSLWSVFHRIITSFNSHEVTRVVLVESLKKSLQHSTCVLTKHHISVIKSLYFFSPNRCIEFIINDFLAISFELFFKSREYFISKKIKILIKEAFQDCISIHWNSIVQTFLDGGQGYSYPSFPKAEELNKFPMVLSDRDVLVLLDILQDTECIEKPLQLISDSTKYLFKNGYSSFTFDLYYPVLSKIKEAVPPHKIAERYWTKICTIHSDPIAYILEAQSNNKLPALLSNEGFMVYIYSESLNSIQYKYSCIDWMFGQYLKIQETESFSQHTITFQKGSRLEFVELMVKPSNPGRLKSKTKLEVLILKAITYTLQNPFPENLNFELLICVLNKYTIPIIPQYRSSYFAITRLLSKIYSSLYSLSKGNPIINILLDPLRQNLDSLVDCGIGQYLLSFLLIIEVINKICSFGIKIPKESLFALIIVKIRTNDIFPAFFLINEVVSSLTKTPFKLEDGVIERWSQFSELFLSLLGGQEEIIQYFLNNKIEI